MRVKIYKHAESYEGFAARIKRILFEGGWSPHQYQISKIIGRAIVWQEVDYLKTLDDLALLKYLEQNYVEKL
jgi:hypothetical protein